jgi:hypothetical protein
MKSNNAPHCGEPALNIRRSRRLQFLGISQLQVFDRQSPGERGAQEIANEGASASDMFDF